MDENAVNTELSNASIPTNNVDIANANLATPPTFPELDLRGFSPESRKQIKDALKSKVTLVSPDGDILESTNKTTLQEIAELKGQGYEVENPIARIVRETVAKKEGLGEVAKQAISSAANQLAFGVPDIAQDKLSDPLEKATRDAVKDKFLAARIVGGAAGFAGNLALSSGLGLFSKAAQAGDVVANTAATGAKAILPQIIANSNAAKIVGNIAKPLIKGGTEGALYAAPAALTEAVLGDPETAAETLLIGSGLGAGINGMGGLLSHTLSLSKRVFGDSLESISNKAAVKSIGGQKRFTNLLNRKYKKATPERIDELGTFLQDKGYTKLGTTISEQDALNSQLQGDAGAKMQAVYDTIDQRVPSAANANDIIASLENDLGKQYRGEIAYADREKDLDKVIAILESKASPEGEMSLSQVQTVQNQLKDIGHDALGRPIEKQNVYKDSRGIIKNYLEAKVDEYEKILPGNLYKDFLAAKKQFQNTADVDEAIKNAIATDSGNSSFGLSDMLFTGGGAGLGGLPGAVGGLLLNKVIKAYGDQAIANSTRSLSKYLAKTGALKDEVISNLLSDGTRAELSVGKKYAPISAMSQIVGELKGDKEEKLQELSDRLASLKANPETLSNIVSNAIGPVSQYAPQVATNASIALTRAIDYIQNAIPKTGPENIFTKQKAKVKDSDITVFEQKLNAALNPLEVLREANSKPLPKVQIDTINALYPKLLQSIKNEVLKQAAENEKKVAYRTRQKLSQILQSDVDGTKKPEHIAMLQQNFALTDKQEKAPTRVNFSVASSTATDFNRAMNR